MGIKGYFVSLGINLEVKKRLTFLFFRESQIKECKLI